MQPIESVSPSERIERLIARRFPHASRVKLPLSSRRSPELPPLQNAVEAYRKELAGLTPEELSTRYNAEFRKYWDEVRAKAALEESQRPFNQPDATADFEHWSKAAHWTLDEAIALSFGKAPEVVGWNNVQAYLRVSPFAVQYARRRDLAIRAMKWELLFDPVLPGIFLAWAGQNDIEVPARLISAVQKRGIQVANWQSLYDDSQKRLADAMAFIAKIDTDWRSVLEAKDAVIASLGRRLEEFNGQPVEKSLGTKERETLLTMVICMAVGGYGYDPGAKRSDKPGEIADDVTRYGLSLDADTIRKWLKQAGELFPQVLPDAKAD